MAEITKAQMEQIEAELTSLIGKVVLRCDGYTIEAYVRQEKMRLVVMVYVNGWFKGDWIDGDHAEARFLNEKKRFIFSKASRERMLKAASNKRLPADLRRAYERDAAKATTLRSPLFPNGKAFLRHMLKVSDSVEVVAIGYGAIDEEKAA